MKMWSKDLRLERQVEDVSLLETHIGEARGLRRGSSPPEVKSGEISTEVKSASGLRLANVTVWAPTPQPASRTWLPAG